MPGRYEFREMKLYEPEENLRQAIGLIQAEILATDTELQPDVLFANLHMPRATLEMAVALLVPLLSELRPDWRASE